METEHITTLDALIEARKAPMENASEGIPMSQPLTPEEAREEADRLLLKPVSGVLNPDNEIRAKTLRLYADQADALTRLAEYEEAVGELLEARLAFGQAINERRLTDSGAETRLRDAFERLRALQEK